MLNRITRPLLAVSLIALALLGLSLVPGLAGPVSAGAAESTRWIGSWAAAQQAPGAAFDGDWSTEGFSDQTVRQVVRVSTGGRDARIRLSNVHGTTPLRIAGGTVARAAGGGRIQPGTMRPLTFGSHAEFVLPPGAQRASDPIGLPVGALDRLAVTLYFAEPTGPAQLHRHANTTSYRAEGDHRADPGAGAFRETSESWYYLSGVDVLGAPEASSVVTFGDSITDGTGSRFDADNRYPDQLAERLVRAGSPDGVLNSGIGGNRMLTGSPCFGESATARFERDVLEQPGVDTVVVLEGINDIGAAESPDDNPCFPGRSRITPRELIAAHHELIQRAHAAGIRILGATLTPYRGANYYTEYGESVRQRVNRWIRTSGEYDAVVDFDRALADPHRPRTLAPAYDSGDHLHPSDAGYRAMAEAVDLRRL